MKYPIPRPKKIDFTGGMIPATFECVNTNPIFDPAVRAFKEYTNRFFDSLNKTSTELRLIFTDGLDDGYRISIHDHTVISASTNVGMNYALATLLQLIQTTDNGLVFPHCEIIDAPDSNWRGVMIDVVRCFHNIEYLYAVADLCWFYKINRFQLHLTDDQAIRFPFSSLPNAVSDEHYTREELTKLIEYCHDRGITIVPEIDAPGHFRAFNTAYPELFGPISEAEGAETTAETGGVSGIMRAQEQSFDIMQDIFKEVTEVFYDSPWIHIGGDEAQIDQWANCDASMKYCTEHGLSDIHDLYGHCVARFSQMILDMDRIPVVWEGFSEKTNPMIPKETLVFSWESYYQIAPSLLRGGFNIINASWQPLYIVHPQRMWPTEEILDWEKNRWNHWWEKSLATNAPIVTEKSPAILGGQICVWGDRMQPSNGYAPRPQMLRDEFASLKCRLPALAEKTWTSYQTVDKEEFMSDLHCLNEVIDKLLHSYER